MKPLTPFVLLFFVVTIFGIDMMVPESADARSRRGGKSFSRSRSTKPPAPPTRQVNPSTRPNKSKTGFMRGMAGGLLGGAIGGMLFGSMFGGAGLFGSGMGLLPILLILGIGYFLFKNFFRRKSFSSVGTQPRQDNPFGFAQDASLDTPPPPPPPPAIDPVGSMEDGIETIQRTDGQFDPETFKEVAQDVFFQVQAGWIRRDLGSFRGLLGDQLANEYRQHFEEMTQKGQLNKLENISVRKVEIVDSGIMDQEMFVTILFTANLLDYTVEEKSGNLIEGSMTDPVKFAEKWTWAKKVGETNWLLEGIDVVKG